MIRTASIICVTMICLSGFSHCDDRVRQSPPDLFKNHGESAQIQCLHSVQNYDRIGWYRQIQSTELTFIGYRYGASAGQKEPDFETKVEMSGDGKKNVTLTIKDLSSSDSAVYFCAAYDNEAYFGGGTKLTVLEKGRSAESPKVEILNVSSTEVCNKEAVTLVCLASKFYPDHVSVSWDMNGEEMGNVATDNAATRDDKYYSISSRLQIPYQTWTTGKTFTCTVKFFNGTGYENHPASIRGPVDSGRNEAATFVKSGKTTMLAYGMIIVKSVIYGIFIIVVIKKQDFRGK